MLHVHNAAHTKHEHLLACLPNQSETTHPLEWHGHSPIIYTDRVREPRTQSTPPPFKCVADLLMACIPLEFSVTRTFCGCGTLISVPKGVGGRGSECMPPHDVGNAARFLQKYLGTTHTSSSRLFSFTVWWKRVKRLVDGITLYMLFFLIQGNVISCD